jgi:hypothetical protein
VKRLTLQIAGALASLLVLAAPALGHRLAPSYLSLVEGDNGQVVVTWKTPRVVSRGTRTEPIVPCPPIEDAAQSIEGTAFIARWTADCSGTSLVGAVLGVEGLSGSGTDALVHVILADGREMRAILTADTPHYTIPEQESWFDVGVGYVTLGFEHLASGLDHILFVIGLLALLSASRRLLLAISAFTLGHSFTLAIAALDLVRVPSGPVELGIAATLVMLAVELARPEKKSLLRSHPGWMPFGFGLLHGLGFAGALAELGLPQQAIPLALFSFNVGIELGQIALVLLALPVLIGLERLTKNSPVAMHEIPATVIGSLGVYWGLQRSLDWLLG